MIEPGSIPQIPGDIDVVATHGQTLKTKGQEFSDTGSDVHTTWQGLSAFYSAPEAATLFAATTPVQTKAADVGSGVVGVGGALVTYADAVRPIQARLASLKSDALAFRASVDGDDDWDKDQDKVDRNNDLLSDVNAQFAAWQAAQRDCANTINALYGGTQYVQNNGDETQDPNEYGYSADQLAMAEELPWGKSEERDKPWYEDTWDGVASVGKGFFVDGLWGDVKGLGNLVGFGGADGAKEAWLGVYKLGILAVPPLYFTAITANQFTDLPGIPKGTLIDDYKEMGKGLLAWDTWKEDPARAFGNVTYSVVSVVFGTKGAGGALKVGKVGAFVDKIAGTVRVGGDIGKVEVGGLKAAETAAGKLDDAALKIDSIDPPTTPKVDVPDTPKVDVPGSPKVDLPESPKLDADAPPRASDAPGGEGPRRTETPAHDRPGADTAEPPKREPRGGDTDGPGSRTAHDDPAKPTGRDTDRPGADAEKPAPREDAGPRTGDREPALVGAPAREAADAADVPPERSVTNDRSDISDPVEKPNTTENGPTDRGPTANHETPGGQRTDTDPVSPRDPVDNAPVDHTPGDHGTGDHGTGDHGTGDHGGGSHDGSHTPEQDSRGTDGSTDTGPGHAPEHTTPSTTDLSTPLEAKKPLPTLDATNVVRDPHTGLITDVVDKTGKTVPVEKYVTDLTKERAEEYIRLRGEGKDPAFIKRAIGPVNSVGVDLRTGQVIEGLNKAVPPGYRFHPILEDRVTKLYEEAKAHGPYTYGESDVGKYPHPSTPGTHAEIYVVDRLLKERFGDRIPTAAEFEQFTKETYVDNFNLQKSTPFGAPCCANCSRILNDINVGSGKLWQFPAPPRTR